MVDKGFVEHFDQVTRVTCRAVRMIPMDQLDMKPTPEMMSAKELAGHIFAGELGMMSGARNGTIVMDDFTKAAAQAEAALRGEPRDSGLIRSIVRTFLASSRA